jgi:flagellar protein FliO/FliZ
MDDALLLFKSLSGFVFVLALMLLLSWVFKKAGGVPVLKKGDRRRLKVVETLPIDHKRRLVLVRRDDKEHLLVLGPETETVVEAGIVAVEGEDDHVVPFEKRDPRNVKI